MVINSAGVRSRTPPTNDSHLPTLNGADHNSMDAQGVQYSATSPMPIAVVGMACRFAGDATNPQKLWDLCASGRDAWSKIPESRFDYKGLYDANREKLGRSHATGGYFLQEDPALFDAGFFNFTGEVATAMDPQLRLLLEVVYEATEDAGIPLEKLSGPETNTSVMTGVYTKDYHDLQTRDPESMPSSTLTGNYTAMFSNRVSHFYDFQGASMSIDTGCSAALAALHQGCQTIRSGESQVSIIGAPNTILNPDIYIAMSNLGMVGADGRCYAWDSRAQGYGRGEGVAALVLKSVDAALRDGDRIHAVIRNSALNQDGKTTTITSPSMDAQIRLIRDCYRRTGLDLSETGYVEAHMTGTQAGDVCEAESLATTFGASRAANDPIWIGSVKTNVGHTEGVSGLAGIIKTAMAMKHRSIPPNMNYIHGNPKIPLKKWNLQVPTSVVSWPQDKPLRASINNFGYGGLNSHVILEGPPEQCNANGNVMGDHVETDVSRLYMISAQDSNTTKTMAKNLAAYLREQFEEQKIIQPRDLAFTLSERKSHLSWVGAVRARNVLELADRLEQSAALKVAYAPASKQPPRLGFVFNGQGAQWHAMGRELLYTYPVFSQAVDKADAVLRKLYGSDWSLKEELLRDAKSTRVSEIQLGQPITVALQICLVVLLRSWGIYPSAVTSHSSGEIAAAYAAGALSFEEALGVTYHRGELARVLLETGVGGMAAGGVGPAEAEQYVVNTTSGGRVVVACVNSPGSVTFSGDMDDLDEVVARLEADGKFARKLKVPLAYHSHHMERMAAAYTGKLRQIVPAKPVWSGNVLYTSPVTGGVINSASELTPEHYVKNLTSPVLFSQAFDSMCFSADGAPLVDAVVEIGPHSTLAGPMREILQGRKVPLTTCLKRPVDAVDTMQDLAAELLRLGYPVSLADVNHYFDDMVTNDAGLAQSTSHVKFVPDLPLYPWNHTTRYWIENRINKDIRHKKFPPHELLGVPLSGAVTPTWRNFLRLSDLQWAGDHRVDGVIVLPGAAYVSMAFEAVRMLNDPEEKGVQGYKVQSVEFLGALTIPENPSSSQGVEMQVSLQACQEPDHEGWYRFAVRSLGGNDLWQENCHGLVSAVTNPKDVDDAVIPDTKTFLGSSTGAQLQHMDGAKLRARVTEMGIEYGPAFQGLTDSHASTVTKRAATNLQISAIGSDEDEAEQRRLQSSYVIHPTTLDCIVQATYMNLPPGTGQTAMVLPRSIHSMFVPRTLNRDIDSSLKVFSELRNAKPKNGFASNVFVVNGLAKSHGESQTGSAALLEINQLFCQAIPRVIEKGDQEETLICETRWEPDVLHSIPTSVQDSMRIKLTDLEVDFERKLQRASYYLIADAAAALEGQTPEGWAAHHLALFDWMKDVIVRAKTGQLAPGSKVWARATKGVKQMLFDELKASGGPHGNLVLHWGKNLAQVIRGEITPADVARQFGDETSDLRSLCYQGMPGLQNRSYKQLAKLVQLFAVKNPGAKVLELNAGTGAASRAVLDAFSRKGDSGSLIGHYTITDTSSTHFDAVKQKLGPWIEHLEFRELDVEHEEDPIKSANLTAQSMDMIVASMPLSKSRELARTLARLRKLLKPNGKMLIIEPAQARLDTQLILGTLPGWEEAANEPVQAFDAENLNELLRVNGFSGIDFYVQDCEQLQYQSSSVFLTSVTSLPAEKLDAAPSPVVSIVVPSFVSMQHQSIKQLTEAIHTKTSITTTVESLEDVRLDDHKTCILIDGFDGRRILGDLDETTYYQLRQMLLGQSSILWLTSGGGAVDAPTPASAQVQGFLRSIRQEDTSKAYMLLDLPSNWSTEVETHVDHIVRVLERTQDVQEGNSPDIDWEYAVKDSVLYVPRIYPAHQSDYVSDAGITQPFQCPGRPLVWEEPASGEANFVEDFEVKAVKVLDGLIEIDAQAFSLNVKKDGDVLDDENEANLSAYQVAGTVTRLGGHTEVDGLQVGDRVFGIAKGPFASTVHLDRNNLAKIPESMSVETAACLPFAYAAAYHALVNVARVQRGDYVLVLHAAGDVQAEAALVLASEMGCEALVATSGSESEARIFAERHHLHSDRVIPQRRGAESISESIMTQTRGRGAHVVIANSASSSILLQCASASISRFGNFVTTEPMDKVPNMKLLSARCATYSCVGVLQLAEHDGQLMRGALAGSAHIASSKSPFKATRFPMSQLGRALEHQQQKGRAGDVVMVNEPADLVKVADTTRSLSLDDTKATYLVVGGIGGIGGAIVQWMVSQGAKNVLVVSRNVETHHDAARLTQESQEAGCNLRLLNCDVSDKASLVRLLEKVKTSMPPIRGVVHAAAVLDDSVLERMTFGQWQRAVQPKVAGSQNLHNHLPRDLSFFVLLSSITGVAGHLSQSNYAAANMFEDALVRHRVAAGLSGVSLDLPAISGAGMVADDDDARRRVESLGTSSMSINSVLDLIDSAIQRDMIRQRKTRRANVLSSFDNTLAAVNGSQVIAGLLPWSRLPSGATIRGDRRFGTLRLASSSSGGVTASDEGDSAATTDPTTLLTQAIIAGKRDGPTATQESKDRVTSALAAKLAAVFSLPLESIDVGVAMAAHGVDSLVAVDMRNWLAGAGKAKMSIFDILQSPSLREFGGLVLERSALAA